MMNTVPLENKSARLGLHVHVLCHRPCHSGVRGAFGTAHADRGRVGAAVASLCVHRGRHSGRHVVGLVRCLPQASVLLPPPIEGVEKFQIFPNFIGHCCVCQNVCVEPWTPFISSHCPHRFVSLVVPTVCDMKLY